MLKVPDEVFRAYYKGPQEVRLLDKTVRQYNNNDLIGYRRQLEKLRAEHFDFSNPYKYSLYRQKLMSQFGSTYIPEDKWLPYFGIHKGDYHNYIEDEDKYPATGGSILGKRQRDKSDFYDAASQYIIEPTKAPAKTEQEAIDMQEMEGGAIEHKEYEMDRFLNFFEVFKEQYPIIKNESEEGYYNRVLQLAINVYKSLPESKNDVNQLSNLIYDVVSQKTDREVSQSKELYNDVDSIRTDKISIINGVSNKDKEDYLENEEKKSKSTPQTEQILVNDLIKNRIDAKAVTSDIQLKERLIKQNPTVYSGLLNDLLEADVNRKEKLLEKHDNEIKIGIISQYPQILNEIIKITNPELTEDQILQKKYDNRKIYQVISDTPLDVFIEGTKNITKAPLPVQLVPPPPAAQPAKQVQMPNPPPRTPAKYTIQLPPHLMPKIPPPPPGVAPQYIYSPPQAQSQSQQIHQQAQQLVQQQAQPQVQPQTQQPPQISKEEQKIKKKIIDLEKDIEKMNEEVGKEINENQTKILIKKNELNEIINAVAGKQITQDESDKMNLLNDEIKELEKKSEEEFKKVVKLSNKLEKKTNKLLNQSTQQPAQQPAQQPTQQPAQTPAQTPEEKENEERLELLNSFNDYINNINSGSNKYLFSGDINKNFFDDLSKSYDNFIKDNNKTNLDNIDISIGKLINLFNNPRVELDTMKDIAATKPKDKEKKRVSDIRYSIIPGYLKRFDNLINLESGKDHSNDKSENNEYNERLNEIKNSINILDNKIRNKDIPPQSRQKTQKQPPQQPPQVPQLPPQLPPQPQLPQQPQSPKTSPKTSPKVQPKTPPKTPPKSPPQLKKSSSQSSLIAGEGLQDINKSLSEVNTYPDIEELAKIDDNFKNLLQQNKTEQFFKQQADEKRIHDEALKSLNNETNAALRTHLSMSKPKPKIIPPPKGVKLLNEYNNRKDNFFSSFIIPDEFSTSYDYSEFTLPEISDKYKIGSYSVLVDPGEVFDVLDRNKKFDTYHFLRGQNATKGGMAKSRLFLVPQNPTTQVYHLINPDPLPGKAASKKSVSFSSSKPIVFSNKHELSTYGYHDIKNLSEAERHKRLDNAIKNFFTGKNGLITLEKKLRALSIVNKNINPNVSSLFKDDLEYVKEKREKMK